MFRYVHTNIIAKDAKKLIDFYKTVLHCESINEARDLRGDWLDKLTGLKQAHISGEHLLLPGYGNDHPTLEIFSYDTLKESTGSEINRPGFAHIAFEVDNVEKTLAELLMPEAAASESWLLPDIRTDGERFLFMPGTRKAILSSCKAGER